MFDIDVTDYATLTDAELNAVARLSFPETFSNSEVAKAFWSPAADYNHAAQLRREIEGRGLLNRYANILIELTSEFGDGASGMVARVSNATPRQITIAAIRAAEGNTK